MLPTLIILGVLVLIILIVIGLYNGLVRAKTRVDETWRQIDVRLQNRYDLLPDLIQAVEKAVSTDQEIQTKIAELRSAADRAKQTATSPDNALKVADVEQRLTNALQGLRVSVESYPELRSQVAIQNFMSQDERIEEMIAAARKIYNTTAREYNEKVAVVPTNIIASMFNFKSVQYFEAVEEARKDISADWGGKVVTR